MIILLVDAAVRSLLLGFLVGLGLKMLAVRNPQVELTAWIVTLVASLGMPLLMQMTLFYLPTQVVMLPHVVLGTNALVPETASHVHRVVAVHASAAGWSPADLLPFAYGLVATVLVLGLVTGLMVTWQIVRDARPIRAAKACNWSSSSVSTMPTRTSSIEPLQNQSTMRFTAFAATFCRASVAWKVKVR